MATFTTLLLLTLLGCDSEGNNNDTNESIAGTQLANESLVLAVNGRGYLILNGQGTRMYQRSGIFALDSNGFLVTDDGQLLKGFPAQEDGSIIGILDDLVIQDINPALINIDGAGLIYSTQNGVLTVYGQIAMADFVNSYLLTETATGVFVENIDSGNPIIGVSATGPLGTISVGSDHVLAVDYTLELTTTDNSYFVLDDGGSRAYTSAALLLSDKQRLLIDDHANLLLAFGAEDRGAVSGEEIIDTSSLVSLDSLGYDLPPKRSTQLTLNINLDNRDVPIVDLFDHLDASTYNTKYDAPLYDSLGNLNSFTLFFVLTDAENEWQMYYHFRDPEPSTYVPQIGGPYLLVFDDLGSLTSPPLIQTEVLRLYNGAAMIPIDIDVNSVTQLAENFRFDALQNGYPTGTGGRLTVDDCGLFVVSYKNGVDFVYGQLALASFPNPAGLTQNSDGLLVGTEASGEPIFGIPCSGGLAEIIGDDMD